MSKINEMEKYLDIPTEARESKVNENKAPIRKELKSCIARNSGKISKKVVSFNRNIHTRLFYIDSAIIQNNERNDPVVEKQLFNLTKATQGEPKPTSSITNNNDLITHTTEPIQKLNNKAFENYFDDKFLKEAQRKDKKLNKIITELNNKDTKMSRSYALDNRGILFKKQYNKHKIYIPEELAIECIQKFHNSPISLHPGIQYSIRVLGNMVSTQNTRV